MHVPTIKYYLVIFLSLAVFGYIVHHPSFRLGLYGDDWLGIYNCLKAYYTGLTDPGNSGSLPGLLTYLTPYGPINCMTGLLYGLFGLDYWKYYAVSLFLKTLAAFFLFLLVESILQAHRKLLAFLSAMLFLAGYTGLQNTDWAVYMIVYLSVALFFLGLLFRQKFFLTAKNRYLAASLLLVLLSIISSPVRMFPAIFFVPACDLLVVMLRIRTIKLKSLFIGEGIFVLAILAFWGVGVFGTPFGVYSYGGWSVWSLFGFLTENPLWALKVFFFWVGVSIVPDIWASKYDLYIWAGFLGNILLMRTLYVAYKKKGLDAFWQVVAVLFFYFFLAGMWVFSPSRPIGSVERYLLLPFAGFCLSTPFALRCLFSAEFNRRIFLAFILLILLHWVAVEREYSILLSHGRDRSFIDKFDRLLFSEIRLPVSSRNFIYLDFDDLFTQHSVLFGLGIKTLVLSGQWSAQDNPQIYDDKKNFLEALSKEMKSGKSWQVVVERVFAYKLEAGRLSILTPDIRVESANFLTNESSP